MRAPTPTRSGKPVAAAAPVAADSDTAATIARLKADADAARALAERFRRLVESAPDAIVVVDSDARIVLVNAQTEKLFGYAPEELIGQLVEMLVPDAARPRHVSHRDGFRRSPSLRPMGSGLDLSGRRKDGSEVPIEISLSPIETSEGVLVSAAIRDISERRAAQEALRRAHDELEARVRARTAELERANTALQAEIADRHKAEAALLQAQKMEAVGQLTGGIAHDFNNLLTVIMGNLQILAAQVANTPEAELIQAAIGAAKRGAELNRMLLVFSRKQRLAPVPVDLNEMQARVVPMLRRTLGEPIAMNVVPAQGLPHAVADPAQLETALLNLAVNARDAMPDGGTLTIETADVIFDAHTAALEGDVAPGHYVMLAVSDTGVGMTPAVAARAFEPFFTTKETGKGSGLGLAMVYGFVKQSGGHVKIYSELGVGTTVKIFLPAIAEPPGETAKPPPAPRKHPRGSETILVVEDADDVRQLACRLLTGLGYTVLQADDATKALAVLEANPDIDLLFTDVVLPGSMNGPELARVAVARRPDLKVVYTSGYTGGALRQFEKAGSRLPLINKPYSIDDLAHSVRAILDGAESI